MAQDDYPYPEDEFDALGKNRSPQAVHRAPRPWWRVWGPLIAVVVLAPLLAFALVKVATNDGAPSGGTQPTTPVVTTEPTDTATGDGESGAATEGGEGEATDATGEPTEDATPEPPPVDRGVAVSVLNGARVQGLAGSVQERLTGEGWTNVTAGNYTSAQPEVSTVFYANAELQPAAQALADSLGIGPVTELASVESVTIVLRPDFAG